MRNLLVFLAVLLTVSPILGETILTLEASVESGKVRVDVFGTDITDFTALQTIIEFKEQPSGFVSDDFQITEQSGNPVFENQAIWPNEIEFPLIFPFYVNDSGNPFDHQMAGFMLLIGSANLIEKTLLQSIWYEYTPNAFGFYEVVFNPSETLISNSSGFPISYNISLDTIVIPEPSTWALLLFGIGFLALCFRKELFNPFVSIRDKE